MGSIRTVIGVAYGSKLSRVRAVIFEERKGMSNDLLADNLVAG